MAKEPKAAFDIRGSARSCQLENTLIVDIIPPPHQKHSITLHLPETLIQQAF